ncbi:hypothetical protein CEP51_008467 [Fusarium floridanum]|uniref:Uncharacterized protein n=1 Tax=Fusarium floridanum TaxID=1325733 RepID=A0A428RKV4_9HYPO|nr:hypothetical protein CEP51_008467 [Fusarium floridanum]
MCLCGDAQHFVTPTATAMHLELREPYRGPSPALVLDTVVSFGYLFCNESIPPSNPKFPDRPTPDKEAQRQRLQQANQDKRFASPRPAWAMGSLICSYSASSLGVSRGVLRADPPLGARIGTHCLTERAELLACLLSHCRSADPAKGN